MARLLLGLCNGLRNNLRIGPEPVGLLDELAALDLEDLHPATAFMVGSVDLERRNQTAEAEIVDRFEAFLHIFSGRLLAARRLERIADRLDMDGGPTDAAVVNPLITSPAITFRGSSACASHRSFYPFAEILRAAQARLQN